MMDELDIREWLTRSRDRKEARLELGNRVTNAVKETQRVIIRPYPSKLRMTMKQYNLLKNLPPEAPFVYDMKLFKTEDRKGDIINVMDIRVETETEEQARVQLKGRDK